jgi:hypothetical protein
LKYFGETRLSVFFPLAYNHQTEVLLPVRSNYIFLQSYFRVLKDNMKIIDILTVLGSKLYKNLFTKIIIKLVSTSIS